MAEIAKCKFLKECDKSSSSFHALMKRNINRNHISSVTLENGNQTQSISQVAEEFLSFYNQLLGLESNSNMVDADYGKGTEKEIKEAVFSIEDGKSPGPDGFTACFFKKAWNVVGKDFTRAVLEFFSSGRILKQLNHTVIALIPKSNHASGAGDYKSISCCNVMYKVIAQERPKTRGSPFPYLVCDFVLNISQDLLSSLEGCPDFKYHPKCEQLKITHLAFADDLILFSRGDYKSAKVMMDCLRILTDASGLDANRLKSKSVSCWSEGYLGIPLAASQLNAMHYSSFFDRIANLFSGWPDHTLSYAGKLELINSVIQGVECFLLAIFPIPNNVLEHVVKLCRMFLWGGRKKPLVAWREVCLPKSEGGLGVFNIKAWNKALLSRALWNIHGKRDTLWAKWVRHFYLKGSTLWGAFSKHEDSPLFKKMIDMKNQRLQSCGSRLEADRMIKDWGQNSALSSNYWRNRKAKVMWFKEVWKSGCTPKYAFTLWWLGIKGKLLTCDKQHGEDINQTCVLCGSDFETIDHLFFKCNFSSCVWNQLREWLGLRRDMTTLKAALKWLHKEKRKWNKIGGEENLLGNYSILYMALQKQEEIRRQSYICRGADPSGSETYIQNCV
ncbi:uncharacterized protein LOC131150325 [Malania oleifera]|uniref:uncharacterized protein LOC131150325 n=1 Tax=Malania oleifera TaxID=397392 RepID=UPI0025ADC099|nr:uncharacterized protein LOC131150325 [Malania oleifera]